MAIQPSNPPSVSGMPDAPNSATDSQAEFDQKANAYVAAQVSLVPEINTATEWMREAIGDSYTNAVEASMHAESADLSASDAELYSDISKSTAKLEGDWASLSGAYSKGISVYYDGSFWALLSDTNEISLIEPGVSDQWAYIGINTALPSPDFSATFNDSLLISKGFGESESINVSGTDYDLPVSALNFTRTGSAIGMNKSGELQDLSANTPQINSNGILVHDSYTNNYLYSGDFSNSYWSKEGGIQVSDEGVYVPSVSGANNINLYKLQSPSSSGFRSVRVVNSPKQSGKSYVALAYAKKGNVESFSMSIRLDGRTMIIYFNIEYGFAYNIPTDSAYLFSGVKDVGNGVYACWVAFSNDLDGGQDKIVDMSFDYSENDYVYAGGACLYELSGRQLMPFYVPTESSVSTVTSSSLVMENRGNFPPKGSAFTITFDVNADYKTVRYLSHFSADTQEAGDLILIRNDRARGEIQWFFTTSGGGFSFGLDISNLNSGNNRFAFTFDGVDGFKGYVNGELRASVQSSSFPWFDFSGNSNLGSLKNFAIYHKELSDKQIKLLGEA